MKLLKALHENERFSSTEQNIVQYMLAHPAEIAAMTTRELAEKTYTSPAAVFRLCQKLGLKGYNEFKIKFTSEINRVTPRKDRIIHRPVTDKSQPADIVRIMAELQVEAIEETKNEMDLEQVTRIAQWMMDASAVDFYAYDQNYQLAQTSVYNLLQVKCNAVAHNAMNSQIAAALNCDKSHLAIIISRSGVNKRLIRAARVLKERGIRTVLFSVSRDTTLAHLCDEFLYVANTVDYLDFGGSIFSVGVRYYMDVLFGIILSRNFSEAETFYNNFENYIGHIDESNRIW